MVQCRVVEVKLCYPVCRSHCGLTIAVMKNSPITFPFANTTRFRLLRPALRPRFCPKCKSSSPFQQRYAHNPADNPYFESIVDNPPVLVRSGQKHGPGLIVLCRSPGNCILGPSSNTTQSLSQQLHSVLGRGRSSGYNGRQT